MSVISIYFLTGLNFKSGSEPVGNSRAKQAVNGFKYQIFNHISLNNCLLEGVQIYSWFNFNFNFILPQKREYFFKILYMRNS